MLLFSPDDISAIRLSLLVASSATLIALPFGYGVAYVLAFSRLPGKALLEGVVNLPLVLPPVVIGYLLLLSFGQQGWLGGLLGHFGINVIFSLKGAIIASAVVGFPLLVRSIRLGMEGMDQQYMLAARTLGAGWWDTLFSITLPLTLRATVAGMTLMFARSLGEFGATLMIAGNIPGRTQTMPIAIYDAVQAGDQARANSLVLVLTLVAVLMLAGVRRLSSRFLRT